MSDDDWTTNNDEPPQELTNPLRLLPDRVRAVAYILDDTQPGKDLSTIQLAARCNCENCCGRMATMLMVAAFQMVHDAQLDCDAIMAEARMGADLANDKRKMN